MAGQTTNYLFDYPTSTDYVKDGATAIETLADDVDATLFTALGGAYPGLRLVKKQTIGSAVSSVTVTNAFSATYDNYKIIISGGVGSSNTNVNLKIGAATSGYKYNLWYAPYGGSHTGATTASASNLPYMGYATTSGINMNADIIAPFLSKITVTTGYYISVNEAGVFQGILNNTTSYTDFTIDVGGFNMTGGTIYVYGYGAS
jgi:hypothetical protein